MPRFRQLRLTHENECQVLEEEQDKEFPVIPHQERQERHTHQGEFTRQGIHIHQGEYTHQGVHIRQGEHKASPLLWTKQQERTTEELNVLLGLATADDTTGRIVRIPGSRSSLKRKRAFANTEELPRLSPSLSPRLRHGIVFATILMVIVMTLSFLTPLASGQGRSGFFQNVSDWVHAQQMNWQFQSHLAQDAQNNPQPANLPSMTLPSSAYVAIARQDAINVGISPDYFTRQINLESGFNPNAHSPSGAEGIAQFMPGTAAGLGINPWNPNEALNAAAHLMANYAKNYGGDYAKALAAYNGGSGTLQYAINACGAANWMNCLPGETRNYIRVIMGV